MESIASLDSNLQYELFRDEAHDKSLSKLNIVPTSIRNNYNDFRTELKTWCTVVLPYYKNRIVEMKNRSFRRYPATTFTVTLMSMITAMALSAELLFYNRITSSASLALPPLYIIGAYLWDKMYGAPFE